MSEELKPCPFCGGAASTSQDNTLTAWAAYCLDCQAEVVDFCTEDEAIAAWNLRAAAPVPVSTGPDANEPESAHAEAGFPCLCCNQPPPVAARELDVEAERLIMHKALCDISQPANAGCGCSFLCRCETESAEALNATIMRDLAIDALCEAESVIDFNETLAERAQPQPESAPVSTEQADDEPLSNHAEKGFPCLCCTEQAGDAWQVVPKIPTDAMCVAAREKTKIGSNYADHIYRAMLSAAPSPNNSPVGADKEPK